MSWTPEKKREYNKKWRKNNPEKIREYRRKWRRENLEKARRVDREWRKRNLEKAKESQRRYRLKNPDKIRKKMKEWRIKNPDRHFKNRLKRFNLSLDEYRDLKDKGCGICGKNLEKLHFDHDHKTGKFRGLLCPVCNHGLGKLGDDLSSLQRAVDYLIRSKRQQFEIVWAS